MMYVLEPSPVFLEYNGVKIYYVYKNDTECCGVRQFLFGLDDWCSEDEGRDIFDVRDIEGFNQSMSLEDNLKRMIDKGLLKNPDD